MVVCSIVGGESKASLAGAIAIMDKPVERAELYTVLRRHLTDPGPRHVLAVEPDDGRRASFEQWIRAAGATPCVVGTMIEAQAELRRHAPAIAIAPAAEGMAMLTELRARPQTQGTPLLLLDALSPSAVELPGSARVLTRELVESDIVSLLEPLLDRT